MVVNRIESLVAGNVERVINRNAAAATLSSFEYDSDNVGRRRAAIDHPGAFITRSTTVSTLPTTNVLSDSD